MRIELKGRVVSNSIGSNSGKFSSRIEYTSGEGRISTDSMYVEERLPLGTEVTIDINYTETITQTELKKT